MEKCFVGYGEAMSGVYRAFDHEAPKSAVFYVRDRVRCARTAKAHDFLALLHKARQGAKLLLRGGRGEVDIR